MTHITEMPNREPLDLRKPASSQVWAGGLIVLAGLALIILGGCFLIGILELLRSSMGGDSALFLRSVLYLLAFSCFAGATFVLVVGLRGLFRVLTEAPPSDRFDSKGLDS